MTNTSNAVETHAAGRRFSLGKIVAWGALILMIVITLVPLYWMIRTSLATNREMIADPKSFFPPGFTTLNYSRVMGFLSMEESRALGGSGTAINFFQYLRNSFIVTLAVLAGQLFFSALSAYAFARLKFPFREKIFFLYLTALMVPGIVTLIPNYILIRSLGWMNSFQAMIAPTFLFSAFAIFFLRQFFLGINHELEEAGKLDGAGVFGVFWRVVLPMSGPPLATIAILIFISTWNDYMWPLLVGSKEEVRVLTVALGIFRSQTPQGSPDWSGLMAGAVLGALPGVMMFVLMGKRVINSIQFSGYR